jgi:Family of unknown function (DUF5989)
MRIIEGTLSRLGTVGEVLLFLWHRKLWWLVPMFVVLLLLGGLMILAQTTGIAPFIYTLF